MNASLAKAGFLIGGGYALFCCPAILIAETSGWTQAPFHITQLVATCICFASSVAFLAQSRKTASGAELSLASVACMFSGLSLAFFCYVLLFLDMSGMD